MHHGLQRSRLESRSTEDLVRLKRKLAHDLKNLMTVITLNAELLRSRSGTEASRTESLERIREAAEEAVSLMRRLMAPDDDSTPIDSPSDAPGGEGGAELAAANDRAGTATAGASSAEGLTRNLGER